MSITSKQTVTDALLDEFLAFCAIPRPSGHESAMAEYLVRWAKRHKLQVIKDEIGNVVIDKPAAQHFDSVPLTILQSHMDMVCVAESGSDFVPESDPIRVCNDGRRLTAAGTSLGADNGIGMAAALYCLKQTDLIHGPLRAIFTVNEEQGMEGAAHLSPEYLNGRYLINLDWETVDSLANSCADGNVYDFEKKLQMEASQSDMQAFSVAISGLKGGHSGINIHEQRANGIKILSKILYACIEQGIAVHLTSFFGGQADNAIAAEARAVFCVKSMYSDRVRALLEQQLSSIRTKWLVAEPDMLLTHDIQPLPAQQVSSSDSAQIIEFLHRAFHGVYAMSPLFDGLVQSSANVGMVAIDNQQCRATVLARSAVPDESVQIRECYARLSEQTGFLMRVERSSPGWAINPDSQLVTMTCQAFKETTGQAMRVCPVHAGLECGWLAQKNPALEIVSIGPDISNPHSPSETLYLDTLAPFINTLMRLLGMIARRNE